MLFPLSAAASLSRYLFHAVLPSIGSHHSVEVRYKADQWPSMIEGRRHSSSTSAQDQSTKLEQVALFFAIFSSVALISSCMANAGGMLAGSHPRRAALAALHHDRHHREPATSLRLSQLPLVPRRGHQRVHRIL